MKKRSGVWVAALLAIGAGSFAFKDGKPGEKAEFDLVRKKG